MDKTDNWVQFNWVKCNLPMSTTEEPFQELMPDMIMLDKRFKGEYGKTIEESRDELPDDLVNQFFELPEKEITPALESSMFKPIKEHRAFVSKYYVWVDNQPEIIEYNARRKAHYAELKKKKSFLNSDLLNPGTLIHILLPSGKEKYILVGNVNQYGIGSWTEPNEEDDEKDIPYDCLVLRYAVLELPKEEDVK